MIHFNMNNGSWLAVDVGDNAEDIKYYPALFGGVPYITFNTYKTANSRLLPPGNYSIIGIAGALSEGQALELGLVQITKDGTLYKWGMPDKDGLPGGYRKNTGWAWSDFKLTHTDAIASLLRANAIPAHYLILKEQ